MSHRSALLQQQLSLFTLNRVRISRALFCFSLIFFSGAYALDDIGEASSLLSKMNKANRELDYQGVFSYEQAGVMRAIRVTHLFREGLEYEKLFYLNGPKVEVLRRGVSSDCRGLTDRFLYNKAGVYTDRLDNYYELSLRGEDRVAGRDAHIIHLVPKDTLRYGYIYAVDKETGLLLQSLLIAGNLRVMERFQFVDISLDPDQGAVDDLLAVTDKTIHPSADCAATKQGAASVWQAKWVPPGFDLASSSTNDQGLSTLIYTDGLSFFSIFINLADGDRLPEIQAQRGATAAQIAKVMHQGREYVVCVVGEIPADTAHRVAQLIVPKVN